MLDLAVDEFVHFLPQRGIAGRDQRQSAIPWWTVQKSQTCFVPFQICDALTMAQNQESDRGKLAIAGKIWASTAEPYQCRKDVGQGK